MGAFLVYILKSSVCLALFYLFFRILLSKETFHRFNRIALLGVLFLSLLIPFIEVTTKHQVEVQQTMLSIEQILLMAEMEPAVAGMAEAATVERLSSLSWIKILLFVYLAGIVFFACRNLYSLNCLFRLMHSGKREKLEDGITLIVHEQEIAPFSWMRYIVISRKDLSENGREILIHEAAHIRHRHSVDLLMADICIFFQWFNPSAWLLKQELQNIHEYEADETVINEGVNAKEYQLLLIKKAVGTRLYSMANSFNHSKLKKRITMMLKEKSNPWARLKYLYVLPLAAVAVTAFARPEISEKAEEISAVKVNDLAELVQEKVLQDTVKASKNKLKVTGQKASDDAEEMIVFEVVEEMPAYPGGMDALQNYLADRVSASSLNGKFSGVVSVGFTVTETGKVADVHVLASDHPSLNQEAEKIVSGMPDWTPGKQRGRAVPVKYSVGVRFGNVRFPENKRPLILVDDKEITLEAFEKMDEKTIKSMVVLKDSAAISVYGKRAENGVLVISTKKQNAGPAKAVQVEKVVPDFQVSGTVVDEQGRPKAGVSVLVPHTTCGAMTDANGHFSLKAVKGGDLQFSFVGYKTVRQPVEATMSVRMEQEVVNLLPDKSKNLLTIKGSSVFPARGLKEDEQPLYIINGKEMQKEELTSIRNDRIKSVSVLKEETATRIYGDKGKNGVVIVTLSTEAE